MFQLVWGVLTFPNHTVVPSNSCLYTYLRHGGGRLVAEVDGLFQG